MAITRRASLLALPLLASGRAALAQEEFPTRPIRLIVPYPPSGAADLVTRLVAREMQEMLRQPVVVENRAGANGMIGANLAAQAAPDGHTMVLATDGMYAINPHLMPRGTPDPMTKLEPVVQLASGPLVILGRRDLPAESLAELIAFARSRPDELTYGANNTTSAHYLISVLLQREAGIRMRHIAYAGTAAAMPDLLGGRIDLLFGQWSSAGDGAEQRGLKRLAVTSARRFPALRDVPPVAETLPGFDQAVSFGLMAPAGTPSRIVSKLAEAADAALRKPEVRDRALATGSFPVGGDAAAFGALIDRQKGSFGRLIAELGIRLE